MFNYNLKTIRPKSLIQRGLCNFNQLFKKLDLLLQINIHKLRFLIHVSTYHDKTFLKACELNILSLAHSLYTGPPEDQRLLSQLGAWHILALQ